MLAALQPHAALSSGVGPDVGACGIHYLDQKLTAHDGAHFIMPVAQTAMNVGNATPIPKLSAKTSTSTDIEINAAPQSTSSDATPRLSRDSIRSTTRTDPPPQPPGNRNERGTDSQRHSRVPSEALSNEHAKPRKKKSSVFGFLTLKEPSMSAWEQFAKEQRKAQAKNNGKPVNGIIGGVSSQKLPQHVPKVNSKWDGLPDEARKKLEQVQGRSKSTITVVPSEKATSRTRLRGNSSATTKSQGTASSGRTVRSNGPPQTFRLKPIGSLTSRPAAAGTGSSAPPLPTRIIQLSHDDDGQINRHVSVRTVASIDTHKVVAPYDDGAVLVESPIPEIPARNPLRRSNEHGQEGTRYTFLWPSSPIELDGITNAVNEIDSEPFVLRDGDNHAAALAALEGNNTETATNNRRSSEGRFNQSPLRRATRAARHELDGTPIQQIVYEMDGGFYVSASDAEQTGDECGGAQIQAPPSAQREPLFTPVAAKAMHTRQFSSGSARGTGWYTDTDGEDIIITRVGASSNRLWLDSDSIDEAPLSPISPLDDEASEADDEPCTLPNFSRPRPLSGANRWSTSSNGTLPTRNISSASRNTANTEHTGVVSPIFSHAPSEWTRPSTAESTPAVDHSPPLIQLSGLDHSSESEPESIAPSIVSARWKLSPQERLGLGAHIKKPTNNLHSAFPWEEDPDRDRDRVKEETGFAMAAPGGGNINDGAGVGLSRRGSKRLTQLLGIAR